MHASNDNLSAYHGKRDFRRTPEPGGGKSGPAEKPIFVIQEHDASNLHYDFRLEIDNVLKSWAVPKGPSTDPREKRLAMPTEDHPLDYAEFEGVIPEGEYGAGTVLLWDTGHYRNLRLKKEGEGQSMAEAYKGGKIEIWLEGRKIRGGYALIRTGNDDRWLLVKMDDDEADARRKPARTEPESVLTGRTLNQIAKRENQ
jgi:DNA ligase D-like protein (predicted 3'-phosphoesterase)